MAMPIVSAASRLLFLLVRVRMFVASGAGSIGTGRLLLVVVGMRMSVVGSTFFMSMVVR